MAANANVWWCDSHGTGLIGYIGRGNDGLEFSRHNILCEFGFWRVGVTGWAVSIARAVMDDFGNLVRVPA